MPAGPATAFEPQRLGRTDRKVVVPKHLPQLARATIVMIVIQVRLEAFDRRAGDDLQLRVALANCLCHLSKPAVVAAGRIEPVFIADLNVAQREGLWESVGRA